MSLFFSFSASCSLPASAKLTKIVKTEKRNTKFKKMQFWELSFGGSDVLFIVYNYIHRSSILILFSFLFRVFQARWLAYTCHHRTWQSVGSERYCRDLSLCVRRRTDTASRLCELSMNRNAALRTEAACAYSVGVRTQADKSLALIFAPLLLFQFKASLRRNLG